MRHRAVLTVVILFSLAWPAAAQTTRGRTRLVARTAIDTPLPPAYQQGREEQTDRQTRTVKIGTDGELDVSNIAGDIIVTRGGGGDATIAFVKSARARTVDDAKQMLGLVQVDIAERSGRAEIRTRYPNQNDMRRLGLRNANVSVAFTITAPAGTRLTIASISGNASVTEIKGDVSVNTISGNVKIASGGRVATAKSISGSVEIADTQIDGALEAGSISGDVIVRRLRARRLDLGTVSGNVVMQDVQAERVEGHSISGNVDYSGSLAKNGRYELNSHSGDIRIAVAADVGFELDANSFSGSIRSDLPVTIRGQDANDRGRRRALHGVYGDGSAVLDVTTFSGSVVITKR